LKPGVKEIGCRSSAGAIKAAEDFFDFAVFFLVHCTIILTVRWLQTFVPLLTIMILFKYFPQILPCPVH
jgi:hypothetical protein